MITLLRDPRGGFAIAAPHNEGDWFGLDVAGIGDILAFPTDETVIISGLFDGDPDDGRVYVVHKNSFDPFFYEIPFGSHGKSCASAGDLDNDGVNDFIVGGGIIPGPPET